MKTIKNNFFTILILLLGSLAVIALFLANQFKYLNERNTHFQIMGFFYTSPVILDPIASEMFTDAERNSYYFNGDANSFVVNEILSDNNNIKEFVGEKKFESLYNLLPFLRINNRDTDAFRVSLLYSKMAKGNLSQVTDYVNYLDRYFIRPAEKAFAFDQIGRGCWLIKEAVEQLNSLDLDPLNSNRKEYMFEVNRIYLLAALTSNTQEVYANYADFSMLMPKFNRSYDYYIDEEEEKEADKKENTYYGDYDMDEDQIIEYVHLNQKDPIFNDTTNFRSYKNYLQGVYQFRNHNYETALTNFAIASLYTSNKLFSDLIKLMIIRCHVWDTLRNRPYNKQRTISFLKEKKNDFTYKNFANDVEFYITYLNNPEKLEEKEKYELNTNSNEVRNEINKVLEEFRKNE